MAVQGVQGHRRGRLCRLVGWKAAAVAGAGLGSGYA